MVLSKQSRWLMQVLLVLFVGFSFGCISHTQTVKLQQKTPIAAAYLMQYPNKPTIEAVPESYKARIDRELEERNLEVKSLVVDSATFERRRGTEARLRELLKNAGDAPYVMLVESEARFYSYMNGKFRWDVTGRISFVRTTTPDQVQTTTFDTAAFLDFDHQIEPDALRAVQMAVADRVGRSADRFFANLEDVPVSVPQARTEALGPATEDVEAGNDVFAPDDSVYFIMVDRFANGDPSNDGAIDPADPQAFHGGDLAGIIQHLDHLQGLGITTVWLSPVFDMRTEKFFGHGAFHGYWVEDFGRIEPRFGTAEDLERLRQELAKRDMRLLLDVVLNHVGPEAPLVAQHPDWFHGKGGIENWSSQVEIETHDVHGLPDFDQSKPEVWSYLWTNSELWLDRVKPAGFRLDAVKHIGATFWQRYNSAIYEHVGDDFVMLGEQLDGNPASVAKIARDGKFNAIFDFPLHFAMIDVFCKDAPVGRLASILSADRLYPARILGERRAGLVTLLDNHDLPRIASLCERQDMIDAMVFMTSTRGTPSFTWGTEVGLDGAKEPENRADMRFEKHALGDVMTDLLTTRSTSPSLNAGRDRILKLDKNFFAYLRVAPNEVSLISINRSNADQTVPLPKDLGGGEAVARPGTTVSKIDTRKELIAEFYTNLGSRPVMRRVTIALSGVPADATSVKIVGSGPEIGNWSPDEAPTLQKEGDRFVGQVPLPEHHALAFKFVVETADGATWESRGDRFVLVGDDTNVTTSWNR